MTVIVQETPLQDDVREMIGELNSYLIPLSPPQYQFQMTAEEMAQKDTMVFVARDEEGKAAGMGSLKLHEGGVGEIKRMYTRPVSRGTGLGREILDHLIEAARENNLDRLVLETGSMEGMKVARRLYETGGFNQCGPVLDYPDSEYNSFYEMNLN